MQLRSLRRRMAGPIAVFGIITAAVIWAKLRLVGDVPRTAYAEPEQQPLEPAPKDND